MLHPGPATKQKWKQFEWALINQIVPYLCRTAAVPLSVNLIGMGGFFPVLTHTKRTVIIFFSFCKGVCVSCSCKSSWDYSIIIYKHDNQLTNLENHFCLSFWNFAHATSAVQCLLTLLHLQRPKPPDFRSAPHVHSARHHLPSVNEFSHINNCVLTTVPQQKAGQVKASMPECYTAVAPDFWPGSFMSACSGADPFLFHS